MAKESDIHKEALEQWGMADDADSDNRQLALDDKKFAKLGGKHQWPEKIYQQRRDENRPCLTINRMPQFLKQVINDQRMNKPSITVRPVDDQGDPVTARIYQGLIRNIEVSSGAEKAYDTAFDDAVTMGFGFFRIVTEYANDSTFELDIKIKEVANAFTVSLDPDDWFAPKFGFVSEMIKREVFKKKYGFLPSPVPGGNVGTSMQKWYAKEDEVRIAEYWRVDTRKKTLLMLSDGSTIDKADFVGELQFLAQQLQLTVRREREVDCPYIQQYLMTGQEFAGEPTEWAGKYIPIVPVLGEVVDIEGKKHIHGLVRHAKDPAQMFNFWRTAATELVALAPKNPWLIAEGQIPDGAEGDKWGSANRKTYDYLTYDPSIQAPPPQRQPFAGVPAGALQEALNASDDMKSVMGLYDASLGAKSNETSGRAILARQREGDVSTFNFQDNLSRSLEHAGRILIDLIPKVYDTARVIRIINPDDKPTTVKVNQEFMDDQGRKRKYDLSVGKYDVVVKAGPSFTTQREEARESILELIRVFPQAAAVVGPLLVKNMDFPDAEEVAQQLKALLPPQAQGQNPQMQQAQAAINDLRTKLLALEQENRAIKQDKELEARKLDIDAYGKYTDRLKALGLTIGPGGELISAQLLQDAFGMPDIAPDGGAQPGPGGMPPQGPPMNPGMGQGPMPPQGPPMGGPQLPQEPPPGGFFMPETGPAPAQFAGPTSP